ncbi:hypothetical protein CR513_39594, partial [Mucuna pruriens]
MVHYLNFNLERKLVIKSDRGGEYYVSTKAVNTTPYEFWNDKKSNIKHLHIWGCPAKARPYRPHERKLDSRTVSCYFVGYAECSRGYKFYDLTSRSFFETRNARFLEEVEFEKEENIRNINFEEESINDIGQVLVPIVVQATTPIIEDNSSLNKLKKCHAEDPSERGDIFNMKDSKPGNTPIAKGDKFSLKQCPNNDLERNEMQKILYALVVGSLMCAQVCTRPDIAFVIGVLGKETKRYMLTYQKSKGLEIIEYSNSDFAGCQDSKRSTSGYIYMLARGAISWKSVKQTLIAPSTMGL